MADNVRRVLEEMVPELEDLEKRGYFNKAEIKQIVQKRQDFEYNLRRRAALKVDFQRYIDYEKSLERLRQLRRKTRAIDGPDTLADHCIVRRTHFIYERALRKFKGDLSFWSQWLRFCQKSKSTRQMSRVLTRALQLHPTVPSLWTYAAAWEFEHNGNAIAARALMQRGLRMCKEAPAMWHEYFRMELLYAARLVARRQVLGLTIGNGTEEGAETDDASATAAVALLRGAVAKVVYSSAVNTVSDSLNFRAGFLEVLESVELPGKEELESYILNDIATAFGNRPGAVALQARRKMIGGGVEAALEVFKSALVESPSEALFGELISFTEEELKKALVSENVVSALQLIQECLKAISEAVQAGQASEYALIAWPRVHLRLGQLSEALSAANKAVDLSIACKPAAMRQKLGLAAAAASLGAAGAAQQSIADLATAVREAGAGRRVEIWCSAIRIAVASGQNLNAFSELLIAQQRGCAVGPVIGGMGGPAASLVTALWSTSGPESARKFYRELLKLPLPGGEFVHAILDAELALLGAGGPAALCLSKIRDLFEHGISAYGEIDERLWLRYFQFEQKQENGKNAGSVHWRAVKAVDNADGFIARAQLLASGYGTA